MRLFLLFVAVGLLLWAADAAMATYVFDLGSFPDLVILAIPPHALYTRALVLLAFVVLGGVLAWHTSRRRKRAEEAERALRDSETKLSAMLRSLGDHVSMLDKDLTILWANDVAKSLFGDDIVGRKCCEVYHGRDEPCEPSPCLALKAFADGKTHKHETTVQTPDGRTLDYACTTSVALRDAEGNPTAVIEISRDVTEQKRAEQALQAYQAHLRHLAAELVRTEERERRRLATHLHDTVGQVLTSAGMTLQDLARRAETTPDLAEGFRQARERIGEAVERVRSAVFDLSPPILHEVGLEAALESLAQRITERHGLDVTLEEEKGPVPLSEETRVVLYRSVRELLHNVVRHADATRAAVSIRRDERRVRIVVEDDGVGFDPEEALERVGIADGFGLFDIRERLDYLGGGVEIESAPGEGTRVTLTATLKPTQ